jgi:multidrug efflux pump subunit AcrB
MEENKDTKQSVIREFGLSSLAVNNRTSVIILTIIIVIMGVTAYNMIPKESFPEIVIPTVYVGTPYPGNSPVDIENLITRPIEKEIKSISGIKDIRSTSVQDYSSIVVEFNPEEDIGKALQDVKDAVDRAKSELPTDLDTDPNVIDIDLNEIPIMYINISGNYSIDELKNFAEILEDEIEKLPEISKCDIKGALEREIRIDADIHKMEAMKVSFGDIMDAVASENVTMSGGNIRDQVFQRSLRITGEFESVDEIRDVVVKDDNDNIVYVKDVADVKDSYEEPRSYARSKLLPVVTLDVVKRGGENLLIAANEIKAILDQVQQDTFPDDLTITITNDQSRFTRSMVNNLENSIITGVILVTLTLMFFMGLRNAVFVGIAIPLSMFMAFMILNAIGYTANMMVLFGLILALGMLVDNGIVVVENIYRLMQDGYSPIRAAKEGVGEVALPIITSTATTLAAFLPLAFWSGLMGEFMKFLPITLIIVLSSSLFVALVINPVLTSMYMRLQEKEPKKLRLFIISMIIFAIAGIFYFMKIYWFANLLTLTAFFIPFNVHVLIPGVKLFQRKFIPFLERVYSKTVDFVLHGRMPYITFLGTFLLLVIAIVLVDIRQPKVSLFPASEPNYIFVYIQKPIGVDIENTNSFTRNIEKEIIELLKPYDKAVESVIAQVGEGASDPYDFTAGQATPNKALIGISFYEYEERGGISTSLIMEKIRNAMSKYPGVQISVDKDSMGPPVGKPINIEISGENLERLIVLSDRVKQIINESNIQGIEELKTDIQTGKPELLVNIDREKAGRFGLSTSQIASELRTALFGFEVSKYKEGEDDYPIQLRLKDEYRYDIDALINKKITFRDNEGKIKQIPISSVASIEYSSTYGSIKRKDLDRVISLYSNVNEGYNANEIISDLKTLLADLELPSGYEIKFTGEQEEQAESSAFLMRALIIAIFSIFLIIVAQFNSVISPFIIMLSVLFSTIGVFLGLVIFNMDFIIIMTGIGIISLAGVVVNNAIVLIDYTNLVRQRRRKELNVPEGELLPYEELLNSIKEGGKIRLRPVLLTAITTILGLLPMAVGLNIDFIGLFSNFEPNIYIGGTNAEFWGPMAWTVIFGLGFATFLTLVVVPVMYLLSDRMIHKFKNGKKKTASAAG